MSEGYVDSWTCKGCESPVPNTYKSQCPICKTPRPVVSRETSTDAPVDLEALCGRDPVYQQMMKKAAALKAEDLPVGVTVAEHARQLAKDLSGKAKQEVAARRTLDEKQKPSLGTDTGYKWAAPPPPIDYTRLGRTK